MGSPEAKTSHRARCGHADRRANIWLRDGLRRRPRLHTVPAAALRMARASSRFPAAPAVGLTIVSRTLSANDRYLHDRSPTVPDTQN